MLLWISACVSSSSYASLSSSEMQLFCKTKFSLIPDLQVDVSKTRNSNKWQRELVIDTSICGIPAWCRAVGEAQPARTIQMTAACEQGYVSNRKILEGITQCGNFYRGKTVKYLKFPLSPSKKLKATNNEYVQRRSQSSSIGKKNLNQGSNWGKPRGGTE